VIGHRPTTRIAPSPPTILAAAGLLALVILAPALLQDEYGRLRHAVGVEPGHLKPGGSVRLNPLDPWAALSESPCRSGAYRWIR